MIDDDQSSGLKFHSSFIALIDAWQEHVFALISYAPLEA
jgi:hypothetical protein